MKHAVCGEATEYHPGDCVDLKSGNLLAKADSVAGFHRLREP